MDFKRFMQILLCKVQLFIGNEYEVSEHTVTKNNGVSLTGVIAKKEGINTFPTVYVNEYYDKDMLENEVEYVAMKIAQRLKSAVPDRDIDVETFTDYEKASEYIVFKVVNADKNKELLMDIPHRRYHNLAIVYMYVMDNDELGGRGTILIRNEHIDKWNVNEEDIYSRAIKNTQRLMPLKIMKMKDIINDMYESEIVNEDIKMYVITNESKLYGAGYICLSEAMQAAYERIGSDFYVLPSSVHELIALPYDDAGDARELLQMVTEINQTSVSREEVLADSVYLYEHESDKLSWIC